MKKLMVIIVLGLALLLMGLTLSASATTINDPANGETHLFQIFASSQFNAGSYANSQALANHFDGIVGGILSALPQSNFLYEITGYYATWAGFTEKPGFYLPGQFATSKSAPFFTTTSNQDNFVLLSTPIFINALTSSIAFYDITSGNGTKATILGDNNNPDPTAQSNGLIFSIGSGQYVVAFEDGGGNVSDLCNQYGLKDLGDVDYNDLVFMVQTTQIPAPLPPSALLMGSGLLGLVGLGWRRRKTNV